MSEAPKDGGPAFPNKAPCVNEADKAGMSLRDWFAGQALAGLLAGYYSHTTHHNLGEVPVEAYKIADAMLEARK